MNGLLFDDSLRPGDRGYLWKPEQGLIDQSRLKAFLARMKVDSYGGLLAAAASDPETYWNRLIDFLDIRFYRPYEKVVDLSEGVAHARWCVGGTTNLVMNCVDKHVSEGRGDAEALIWISEEGAQRIWTYAELDRQVCRIASSLVRIGCRQGDVVALYMPIAPETVASFLAVAKIGCIALPLFSGFGADALATRANAAGAKFIVTADGARRRGKIVPMKPVVDAAVASMPTIRKVVVFNAVGSDCAWNAALDLSWDDFLDGAPTSYRTAELDAETPFMVLYTSGTTGLPKGAVHTHCGFMAKMGLDYNIFSDVQAGDRYLWMSDLGWFVVPAQIVFTGLVGATMVLPEGVPDYPADDRLLRIVSDAKVSIFGMSPTLARMLRKGWERAQGIYDFEALRVVISGGEPWDVPTWTWVMDVICRGKAPILNQCGGSEIGSLLLSSIIDPMRPGGFSGPAPGTGTDIVDQQGVSVPPGAVGDLVMRQPSIGTTRGLWRENERYLESYWRAIPGMWVQGDLASRDADGFWFVHGRSDDTLKIAGKRTGPAEIETALISTGDVAEAAAVGVPDAMKGSALVCVVVGKNGVARPDLNEKLKDEIVARLGRSFRPRDVIWVRELPRNRSNKILRRLVRSALTGAPTGDLSTVANPEALDELRAAAASSATSSAPA
jgi:acetyl-CoA synthetase